MQRTVPGSGITHRGRVTHICVGKLSNIGSENGLSPSRRQAIIWTNAGILLIGTLGTNFSEIAIEIYTFSFKKMHLKMSSGKWRPCCLGLNVLILFSLPNSSLLHDAWETLFSLESPQQSLIDKSMQLSRRGQPGNPHVTIGAMVDHWGFSLIQWNLSITTTSWDTSLPSGAHLAGQGPPRWASESRHC